MAGKELQWFNNDLTGRSKSVSEDGHLSESSSVNMGVPQGPILGPLLVLPSITKDWGTNMLDTELNTAEKLIFSNKSKVNLNNDLSKLNEYLDYNRLNLTIPKCEFILIGTQQALANIPNLNVHITNEPLR